MAEQLYGPDVIAKLFEFDGVRRVDQLVQDGIISPTIIKENGRRVRKYDLIPTVQQYIRYLKDKAERRASATTSEDSARLVEADLRYKEARAAKVELETEELRGQMHRQEDVEFVVSDMIAKLRAGILALPGQLAVDCAEAKTPTETAAIIKAGVDRFLNETAETKYNAADYRKLVMEREKWLGMRDLEEEIDLEPPSDTSKSSKKSSKRQKT